LLRNSLEPISVELGDEVTAIDGIPVEEKINELKKYVMGSSDEWNDSQAIRALTIRNFKYSDKNYVKVAFKSGALLKLPLFYNNPVGSTSRMDVVTYMNKLSVPSDTSTIGMNFDKVSKTWSDSALTFSGYATRTLHLNLKGLIELTDNDGQIALRTGYYISKGKSYGVLQILNFTAKTVKVGDTQIPFLDAIRNFAAELKENQLPMVLDLRVNGGGNGNYPAAILSILAPEGQVYPGPTSGMRMTEYSRQLSEADFYQQLPAEDQSVGMTIDELHEVLGTTLENGREYTPMYSYSPVKFDQKLNGFNNKIVALVTSDCISACDMMSFLLKSTKRATIIGTHTNGTGAGYSSSAELNTTWQDKLRVLSSHFPNFLFGLPGDSADKNVFGIDSVSKLCTENRPTIADILYSTTPLDVAKNNIGWLQTAASVIEAQSK
jgi:hypothetical protein